MTDLVTQLREAEAALARCRELVEQWTAATCQTDGAPCSWHRVSAECAEELIAAMEDR